MSDLSKTMLIGRLGQDPEIKYTASGMAIANVSIATGRKWKDKQTGEDKEQTEWHRVVFFNRLAEVAGEYLSKGAQVYVEGFNRTRKWQDKDGNDRYSTEVVGEKLQMLGGKGSGGEAKTSSDEGGFRDRKQAPAEDAGQTYQDDDIPF